MRLESDVKEKQGIKAVFKSFKYANEGILTAFKIGRNIKVHYLVSLIVIGLSIFFDVTKIEFMILLLVIAQVICLEMVNTAIERVVDLATKERCLYAKIAKDVAAGAVLFSAFVAVIIGIMIFMPYIKALVI